MKKAKRKIKKSIKVFLLLICLISVLGVVVFIMPKEQHKDKKYDIPKVYFYGDISGMNKKDDVRDISIKFDDGVNMHETYAAIKVQGTSSLAYEKKNYTINLYKDEEHEDKNKLDFGWGPQSKYCLKANWIDKTHARNIVTANLAADIQAEYGLFETAPNNGTIDGFPVEIYINGKFLGLYTWNIPKDAWMFDMDEDNPNHIVFSSEGWNDSNLFKADANYNDWSVEVGRGDDADLEKLNRLITFVNTSSDKEFKENFDQYLDLDSTINYFILMQYAQLSDNIAKNMLLATYDGKVWYPTLYDLDTSWGTQWNGKELMDYEKTNTVYKSKLWSRMVKLYPEKITKRYNELKTDYLNKESIMKRFNDFKSEIPDTSFAKENNRWTGIPGYDYSQIENFLNTREPIVDELINDLTK